ncbi:alkaline ceramidase-like protein [Peziza echinospora]|nr:alkaline ceramidase-like protein [Peziza echinospora]
MWGIPSIPYGEEKFNMWGPVTSTLNWCEEDYVITSYCAEFINTFTNLIFLYVSLRGVWNCYKEQHDKVFLVAWLSFMVVGVGSFLFHATLWYSMQLVDELSMINTTLVMWFATFAHKKSTVFSWIFATLLVSILGVVASVYHYLGDPVFHQNVYTLLTVIVLVRSWYLLYTQVRTAAPEDYRNMQALIFMGLACLAAAFTLWNIDTVFCGELIGWRRWLGLPWGFFLEGHGHWHLLSGLGGYYYITYGLYLRYCLEKRQSEYELVWPSTFTSLPYVRKRRTPQVTNGNGAGATKKDL